MEPSSGLLDVDFIEEEKQVLPENNTPVQSSAAVAHIEESKGHQRIWLPNSAVEPLYWKDDVVSSAMKNANLPPGPKGNNLASLLDRIERQELEAGRMRAKQYGVLHEDPTE